MALPVAEEKRKVQPIAEGHETSGARGASEAEDAQISFSSEIFRKAIHLGSLSIPVLYFYASRNVVLAALIPLTLFSIGIDLGRHNIPFIRRIVSKVFDRILRPHERHSGFLSGASYVLISALLCVVVFPKLITITAFSILIVSDASSALVGRAFGKHKFLDKSLEGTLAFIVSAWVVILLTPKAGPIPVEYFIAGFAAVVGGIAEAWSVTLHLDDNFSIPVSVGLVSWGLYWVLMLLDPAQYGGLYERMIQYS